MDSENVQDVKSAHEEIDQHHRDLGQHYTQSQKSNETGKKVPPDHSKPAGPMPKGPGAV